MAYAIEKNESVEMAIRRIMHEQIARARQQLTDETAPIEKRVHDARKRFKETRALVRLVRKPLGPLFTIENSWFRDAGRDLAAARDAEAVIEGFDKLARSRRFSRYTRTRARKALSMRREAMSREELEGRIANVLGQLDAAESRIESWPAWPDTFETIADGLERTYRGGRREMERALMTRMPEELHEWRKRVKEHWYHSLLLRNVWPGVMKTYSSALENLSRALGDHHDLFVLRQIVARSPRDFGRAPAPLNLVDAIAGRQLELEDDASAIGRHVYAEKPSAWLARMRNYWNAWKRP
jgi:CHAD domain-containing protein